MQSKFIYPTTSPNTVVLKSKRVGFLKRRFQRDMPIELIPYTSGERYQKTIKYLENVSKYTYIGQIVSFIPSVVIGAIMFGVGESKRQNSDFTPIYWYIGIIILGISAIYILIALATIKSKYLKNLSYAIQKLHTEYTNEFGISWTLKYVDFKNKRNRTRTKIWCELTIPNNASVQQPAQHPSPYGNPNQNIQQQQQQQQYIPMNYYYSTQPSNQYPGQGQQLGTGQPLPPPQQPINQPYGYSNNTIPIDSDNNNNYNNKPIDLSKK